MGADHGHLLYKLNLPMFDIHGRLAGEDMGGGCRTDDSMFGVKRVLKGSC